MTWHDNHVHGLQIREGEWGAGELALDLDFILEWLPLAGGRCRFRIAPAILTFRQVTELRLSLDYATPTAGLVPFSIQAIHREPIREPRNPASRPWRIEINWPAGEITFRAAGFMQQLSGREVISDEQRLMPDQRRAG